MTSPQNTQYPSTHFLESAGTVLVNSSRQICILRLKHREEHVLPKGRRNIGENRHEAALRETTEETGYKCHLLPVTLDSWQPPEDDDGGYIHGPVKHEGVREPFMVVHRMLKEGVLKVVWWYLAAVDEAAEVGAPEKQFEVHWIGSEEAGELLSFESDRQVVERAAEILRTTFGESS